MSSASSARSVRSEMIGVAQRASGSFPLQASSVRDARHFLRAFLADADRLDLADQAELALTEVATNAILHAHTGFDVTLHLTGDQLRVEVLDRNPQVPLQRDYGAQATTGRGLELVAALTSQRGVEIHGAAGKAVWFVLNGSQPEPTADELLDRWGVWDVDLEQAAAAGGDGRVVLLGLPSTLWLAAREHHDAILRELALYAVEHPRAATAHDLALADRARGWVSTTLIAALGNPSPVSSVRATEGLTAGPVADVPPLDLDLAVGEDAAEAFATLRAVLDAAEHLAVAGRLLVHPALPELVAVRNWVCEQVLAQLAGGAAAPWPGTAQERFTVEVRERAEPDRTEWDARLVTDADRGAVAADQANRIIAVSRPLAEVLGWNPADLVGRRVVALVPHRLREAHVAGFSRHLTTGETRLLGGPVRLPVLRADGSEIDCEVVIEQIRGQHRDPIYVAWMTPVQ